MYLTLIGNLEQQMITNSKQAMMHTANLSAERLCAGYWAGFTTPSNKQDPIKTASFCKESGHK
jgi:hypothetical protein